MGHLEARNTKSNNIEKMPNSTINHFHTSIVHEKVKLMKKEEAVRICEAVNFYGTF
ncbi:MAG: hypothetical protein IPH58_14340 [Sphingobacteriales bacterium]|nr:hypothetical protein [Sphingobacteriales bacterium]